MSTTPGQWNAKLDARVLSIMSCSKEPFDEKVLLQLILLCAGIDCSEDRMKMVFDSELQRVINQCYATSKFQPALECYLNKTRIPASLEINPGYINLSFIRHAESVGNTLGFIPKDDTESDLTEYGREQAERLGTSWANVRIDAIYTSPYKRAKKTAQILAEHNRSCPELIESDRLVEHDFGPVVRRLMNEKRMHEAGYVRTGTYHYDRDEDRTHCPPGGESLQDVVYRGIAVLKEIAIKHAVALSVPPKEMDQGRSRHEDALANDVPHVVIVSHNIFLAELWEALSSWKGEVHSATGVHYRNANWSRHILKFQGYGANRPVKGYYASDFPFEMHIKDVNPPKKPDLF